MKQNNHFLISRKYSFIPGLQEESEDTYEVTEEKEDVIIRYTCNQKGRILFEQKICASVTFSDAKNMIVFLSENSGRGDSWVDLIGDNNIPYQVIG